MKMQKALLFIALLPPLQTRASDGTVPTPGPSNQQFERAVATLMNSPKAASGPIKDTVLTIGAQAATLQAPTPDMNMALTQAAEERFEKQMADIRENIRRLQEQSTEFFQEQQGSRAENAAALAISQYAHVALNTERVMAQQKQYQQGALAGLSSLVFAWIAKINPVRVYRTSYRAARTRFTGIETAAALSAAGSAAKSLLGPIACIAVVGILWYQFKSWIVQPYKEKHKKEIEKFKEALDKHKKENAQAVDGIRADMGNVRTSMGQALDGLRMHVKDQLSHAQEAHGKQIQTMSEAQAKTLAGIKESNQQLQERLEREHKEFQAQLVNDQAEFTQTVNAFTTDLKKQFNNVQEDVEQIKTTNAQMKSKVEQAVGKLQVALGTMQTIKEGTLQQLTLLKGQKPGAKGLLALASPKGSDKKEKAKA